MLAPLTVRAQRASDHVTEEKVEAAWIQLEALITEEMQKTGVPGIAIGIVYRDKPIYLKGYGVRDVGTSYPVDADTVFQLASLSKPLGSTVIAGLVSDGVVKWDDPIIKYDPGFEMDTPYLTRNVTISDMYSHRSGLHDHAGDLLEDMGYARGHSLSLAVCSDGQQVSFTVRLHQFRRNRRWRRGGKSRGQDVGRDL
jgi:CubicO group peptidase (beta-lactamase class C family)